MRKYFAFLFLTAGLLLQAQVPMGEWKTYLAYNTVSQLTQSPNKVFGLSEGALFSVNKEDGDMEFYSKMSGLNDATISRIAFDEMNSQLLIIYGSGNIDIMHSGGISNIPDLFYKQMNTSKSVNKICFNGNIAYLSCDFGILAVNMYKKEIADTYIIGPKATEVKVLETQMLNGKIYAATENNIFSADASSPHLVNYEYWKSMNNIPGSGSIQGIKSFANSLFLLRSNKLYKWDGISWSVQQSSRNFTNWKVSKGKLLMNDGSTNLYVFNSNMELQIYALPLVAPDFDFDDQTASYWLAAGELGILSYKPGTGNPEISYYKPEGPAVNIPWEIKFSGNRMYVVPGGRWDVQYFRRGWVMIYENGVWNNISNVGIINSTLTLKGSIFVSNETGEAISRNGYNPKPEYAPVNDFMSIAIDPSDSSHFFVSTFGVGLYEFKNDVFSKWHHYKNSTLQTVVASNPYYYTRLDGGVYDSKKNLYIANMNSSSPIKVLKNDGNWTQLDFPLGNKETLGKIWISNQNENQKWVPSVRKDPGIFIFDDNGTLDISSDDKSRFLSRLADPDVSGSFISPSYYYCLTQDHDGTIWVGTDIGPLLFYNTARAFDSDYTCSRVKIPRNDGTDQADYLLKNEVIKAIAVDGANRKWIGTEASGVYLMSANGQETLQHFTSVNSPLLSNNIMSIAIHPRTGEVFFGTAMGIVSFQSDAADATDKFQSVHVFPNPVRETYEGIITITGLVENSAVKIMDLSGNLIYETRSNGSLATWNGRNRYSQKVKTGIYMVIAEKPDGTEGIATKVMIVD